MYLDVFGLVTTGVGNLIDSPEAAKRLNWIARNGRPATNEEIEAEWHEVKAREPGLIASAYRTDRGLILSELTIDLMVARRLVANASILREEFSEWGSFPADAQLGILSLAWAVGAGFPRNGEWPKCTAAIRRRDWLTAAVESMIRTERNPGVVPRNRAQRVCFLNAAAIEENPEALSFAECYWPLELVPECYVESTD
jgi:hypothetical protein